VGTHKVKSNIECKRKVKYWKTLDLDGKGGKGGGNEGVPLTNKIMPKALKAMDMQFHWLRCRDTQGQF
jgi:hypothetical protein